MLRMAFLPLLMMGVLFVMAAQNARAEFRAAAGKVEITPSQAAYIAGYATNRKSVGVHDPLWARCLTMQNDGETVVLVSCDLIGVSRYHAQKIRARVKGVLPERVLIGVTHTHSGPDTYGLWGPGNRGGLDQAWMEEVYGKIAALVEETVAKLAPAQARFGVMKEVKDCSYNARVREILDTELAAMQIIGASGKTVATLINFACHPEVLNNHTMTSDFPHWLRLDVEAALGGVAIYMNGAQGGMVTADIKNEEKYPKGEAWPEAERIGRTLAKAAIQALASAKTLSNLPITFQHRTFRVPMESKTFKAFVAMKLLPGGLLDGSDIETEVSRFTLGPAEFLTFPGEVLPNLGLFLKRKMTGSPKFQLGLTGDALGYILTPQDHGLKLYAYESEWSIGSEMGSRMMDNLLAMMSGREQGTGNRE